MAYVVYDPVLRLRCLRMLEIGQATVAEVSGLSGVSRRTIEGWARQAGLDHDVVRSRHIQTIWEKDTMPRMMGWGKPSPKRVNQLQMNDFDANEIVVLKGVCSCGAKGKFGVFAHFYYTPGFVAPKFVCDDCKNKVRA